MLDKADIADAIEQYPKEAADALLSVQIGSQAPVTLQALAAAAKHLKRDPEDLAADEVERLGLTVPFAHALRAHGVPIAVEKLEFEDVNINPAALQSFIPRAEAFRCRVLTNTGIGGSGCLIGPSLVMTAWHVVASAPPGTKNPTPAQPIEVLLSDGTRHRTAAKPQYESACTDLEYKSGFPTDDAAFNGFDDVALIKLERPEGIRLGYASLPARCLKVISRSNILVLHFPDGRDKGWGVGRIEKIRRITARWRHDVPTSSGSSGGPCFNVRLELVGLHQGKWPPNGRLVPLGRFLDKIRPLVEQDVAPPTLWSLDGTPQGQLVIGRDLFFETVAAASRPTTRVRGLRIKRRDPQRQGTTGLAFSAEMLSRTLKRNFGAHSLLRINFEPPYGDLIDEIRRRAEFEDVRIPRVEAGPGVRRGETTAEATANDRAKVLARELNAASEHDQRLLWFFFENPAVGLTDAERIAFEAFLGAALKEPRLRLVLAGYETVTTPGEEFESSRVADVDGGPGLVVEYFGWFQRNDVEQLLRRASQDMGAAVPAAVITDRANQVLQRLEPVNGQYSAGDLKPVSERIVTHLEYFRTLAEEQP
jgi:Trypsin-like peptidase domain